MVGREKEYAAIIVSRNLPSENLRQDIASLNDEDLDEFARHLRAACQQATRWYDGLPPVGKDL